MPTPPATPVSSLEPRVSSLHRIVGSLGVPFLLFSVSLVVLLGVSWAAVLPAFTGFDVGGRQISASALIAYRDGLKQQIDAAEARRDALLVPVHDAAYAALREERRNRPTLPSIRQELAVAARSVVEQPDAIVLRKVAVYVPTGQVDVQGDVRNVGPRSMTVLAQFVEALRSSSLVAELTPPVFTREEDTDGNFHSPFSLELSLKSSTADQ